MTIFLDVNGKHWLVARDRQELFDALIVEPAPQSLCDLTDVTVVS